MKISLIIPAHNEEKYIGRCLESAIKNSDNKFHEIIVVDNVCTDKTQQIVSKFPSVTLVKENKKGTSAARHAGYKAASGDILAFIDADTRMSKGWVEKIEREFNKNPKLACMSGPYTYYDVSPVENFFIRTYWPLYTAAGAVTECIVIGGNFAIRKSILDKMQGFDTSIEFYGDDTDVARRASQFGTVYFNPFFVMPTSARRFKSQGLVKTASLYVLNFFSQALLHKSATKKHKDIR
jgi:glycosyltransferase involved in cell wall biosynthesis